MRWFALIMRCVNNAMVCVNIRDGLKYRVEVWRGIASPDEGRWSLSERWSAVHLVIVSR